MARRDVGKQADLILFFRVSPVSHVSLVSQLIFFPLQPTAWCQLLADLQHALFTFFDGLVYLRL